MPLRAGLTCQGCPREVRTQNSPLLPSSSILVPLWPPDTSLFKWSMENYRGPELRPQFIWGWGCPSARLLGSTELGLGGLLLSPSPLQRGLWGESHDSSVHFPRPLGMTAQKLALGQSRQPGERVGMRGGVLRSRDGGRLCN